MPLFCGCAGDPRTGSHPSGTGTLPTEPSCQPSLLASLRSLSFEESGKWDFPNWMEKCQSQEAPLEAHRTWRESPEGREWETGSHPARHTQHQFRTSSFTAVLIISRLMEGSVGLILLLGVPASSTVLDPTSSLDGCGFHS